MNKEELEWLLDIATPTGISYSGDQTITIDFANKVINHINKQKEILDKIKEYVENLLKEEFEITDPDNIYYGEKCRKPYFSDSELEKILELLEEIE